MVRCFEKRRVREWLDTVKRFFKRKPDAPEDPCAYVTAPKKPDPLPQCRRRGGLS